MLLCAKCLTRRQNITDVQNAQETIEPRGVPRVSFLGKRPNENLMNTGSANGAFFSASTPRRDGFRSRPNPRHRAPPIRAAIKPTSPHPAFRPRRAILTPAQTMNRSSSAPIAQQLGPIGMVFSSAMLIAPQRRWRHYTSLWIAAHDPLSRGNLVRPPFSKNRESDPATLPKRTA
jgi:hypothetical protein